MESQCSTHLVIFTPVHVWPSCEACCVQHMGWLHLQIPPYFFLCLPRIGRNLDNREAPSRHYAEVCCLQKGWSPGAREVSPVQHQQGHLLCLPIWPVRTRNLHPSLPGSCRADRLSIPSDRTPERPAMHHSLGLKLQLKMSSAIQQHMGQQSSIQKSIWDHASRRKSNATDRVSCRHTRPRTYLFLVCAVALYHSPTFVELLRQ